MAKEMGRMIMCLKSWKVPDIITEELPNLEEEIQGTSMEVEVL
jgi:hypothetical protein